MKNEKTNKAADAGRMHGELVEKMAATAAARPAVSQFESSETETGGVVGNMAAYTTLGREEYERLRRIADAAFWCLGCLDVVLDKSHFQTAKDLESVLNVMRETLGESVKREAARG